MQLPPKRICDNHAALAASQDELFTTVPEALPTLIEFRRGGGMLIDGMPLDLCGECFETVPLKTIIDHWIASKQG